MKASTTIVLLLTSFFCSCPKTDAQTVSGIINSYFQVTAINTTANSVTVDNSSGLTPGELVLIIQSKGASIASTNDANFGNISAINDAGNYEFATICTITGNEVVFQATLLNSYNPTEPVQLVSVPSYGSVVVSGPVTATPWDPTTGKGGVVVLAATDSIYLNANIDVSGQGFQGGPLVNYAIPPYNCSWAVTVNQYYLSLPASGFNTGGEKGEGVADYIVNEEYGKGKQANGGGGGNSNNTGGAGGGNYGAGGAGGQRAGETTFDCHGGNPGIGGLSLAPYGYSSAVNRIFFGGGGGGGQENNGAGEPGGNGGGIIILSAPVIVGGGGQLLAPGIAPLNPINTDPAQAEGDGGGGGGAGGTVILNAGTVTGAVIVNAQGANGTNSSNFVNDCTGPGGGGGGGVIWTAGASIPAAVSASVNGGANGVVSAGNSKAACRGLANGATAGNNGITQTGYLLPQSTVNICVPLAASPLKYFSGSPVGQGVLLSWGLYSQAAAGSILFFTVERSVDQTHFTDLATIAGSADSPAYRYQDTAGISGTKYYRLVWVNKQGARFYSQILVFSGVFNPSIEAIRLQPNPVSDQLSVSLFSTRKETAALRLYAAQGQLIAVYPVALQIGITSTVLPVSGLPAATYFLMMETQERHEIKSFIKK
jgi:hypothetical protein